MKTRISLILLSLLLACFLPANAQKNKAKEKEKAKTTKTTKVTTQDTVTPADLLYENMLENTQRVLVIDSIVVDKEHFLEYIPLPRECGTLSTASRYFKDSSYGDGVLYANEFGNKTYYPQENEDGNTELRTRDKLGDRWTSGTRVEGIDAAKSPNYPFMMADGITFYFAQKGEGSLGGYDIFVTRYDSESGSFLRPNNIGLPFNSKANDFMYVEDELDTLGWFVTDRRQPEGKVCVYTFVPTKKRSNFNLDDISEEEVKNYAALSSIRATWSDKKERDAAMKRLERMIKRASAQVKTSNNSVSFVINDQKTYHHADDFQSLEARQAFLEWQQATERLKSDTEQLEALRERYISADEDEIKTLRPIILETEQEIEQLEISIHSMEKRIRNQENKLLTK